MKGKRLKKRNKKKEGEKLLIKSKSVLRKQTQESGEVSEFTKEGDATVMMTTPILSFPISPPHLKTEVPLATSSSPPSHNAIGCPNKCARPSTPNEAKSKGGIMEIKNFK